jgi:hypothetical protein
MPRSLIIICKRHRLIKRHESVVVSDLVHHSLSLDGIVVAGVMPVVDADVEHGAAPPTVVWIQKITGKLPTRSTMQYCLKSTRIAFATSLILSVYGNSCDISATKDAYQVMEH